MVVGDQVPEIPFGDVVAKIGAVAFTQIGAMAAKSGAIVVVQTVLQVMLSDPTQVIPLAVKLKVTD